MCTSQDLLELPLVPHPEKPGTCLIFGSMEPWGGGPGGNSAMEHSVACHTLVLFSNTTYGVCITQADSVVMFLPLSNKDRARHPFIIISFHSQGMTGHRAKTTVTHCTFMDVPFLTDLK